MAEIATYETKEIRIETLGVHRVSQGCFESDSKKKFSTPMFSYISKLWSLESRPWGYIECVKVVLIQSAFKTSKTA